MPDTVDEAAVRDALEAAYQRKADADPSPIELYAYASDLPAGVDPERARSIAKDVIRDPPAVEPAEPALTAWEQADFGDTNPGVYPSDHRDRASWMVHKGEKMPYAPWSSRNEPAPCSKHNTTADGCDCDARWKWGHAPNRRPFEKAKMALEDPHVAGLAFIQTEDDPFVFVDGDDVRDPDTGAVHPAFRAVLEHLGPTYADVSTSGTGVHAYYRGALPGDETAPSWPLDDEPFGANDDLPEIELYSGKHVCIATGEHVPGTPTDVRRWNGEVLRPLLEANGELDDETPSTDSGSSSRSSTSGSGSDPMDAFNRLDARDVAEKTIVDEWTGEGGAGDTFLPTWGSSDDGGTANFVDETCWVDTGHNGGRGGPAEMAMIDLGELRNENSEVGCVTGSDFWTAYEHLRDLGFNLPEPDSSGSEQKSDYYDARLGEYVDGDPWSDPDAMLAACLLARSEGAVSRDADPPTLALLPIVREYLGTEEIADETREMAAEVFLNELSAAKHVDGRELDL